ncbi:MAG: double zinc ribbon domain-containing protein [Mahellales bacterium]
MAGYKQPCRKCDNFIPPDSNTCPICGKRDPLIVRCPKCRNPIDTNWQKCNCCGLPLYITCPKCGNKTFFDDCCQHCNSPLLVACPNPKCRLEQPPIGSKCIKCGKPL